MMLGIKNYWPSNWHCLNGDIFWKGLPSLFLSWLTIKTYCIFRLLNVWIYVRLDGLFFSFTITLRNLSCNTSFWNVPKACFCEVWMQRWKVCTLRSHCSVSRAGFSPTKRQCSSTHTQASTSAHHSLLCWRLTSVPVADVSSDIGAISVACVPRWFRRLLLWSRLQTSTNRSDTANNLTFSFNCNLLHLSIGDISILPEVLLQRR